MKRRAHVLGCVLVCVVLLASVLWGGVAFAELPKFAKAQMGSDRFGAPHTGWAFGPDEKGVSISENGYVRVWDIVSQGLQWEARPTTRRLGAVSFAGGSVVAATDEGEVFVLSATDGREVKRFKVEPCDDPCEVRALAATDKLIATLSQSTASESRQTTLRLWSAADGRLLQSHTAEGIEELALSPDSSHVAWLRVVPDYEGAVFMASAASLKSAHALAGALHSHDRLIKGQILFSPDSKTLAAVGGAPSASEGLVHLWTTHKPEEPPRTIKLLPDTTPSSSFFANPQGALFSTDSKWLSIVHEDGNEHEGELYIAKSTHVYVDVAKGTATLGYSSLEVPQSQTWVSNDRAAATALGEGWTRNRPIYVMDDFSAAGYELIPNEDGPSLDGLQGSAYTLIFDRNQKALSRIAPDWMVRGFHTAALARVASNEDGSEILSVDAKGRALLWRQGQADAVFVYEAFGLAAFSPQGALFEAVAARLPGPMSCSEGDDRLGDVARWDLGINARRVVRRGLKLMTQTLHWLADGKLLTCREEHKADVIECRYPKSAVQGVFETMNADGTGIKALKGEFTYCPPPQAVSAASLRSFVVYAPGALPSDPPEVGEGFNQPGRVIDLKTGAVLMEASEDFLFPALSLDGKWYAAFTQGDSGAVPAVASQLKVYDINTKAVVAVLDIPSPDRKEKIHPTLFSPDSKRLIVARGAEVLVIDPATKAVEHTLTAHTSPVHAFAFSGDGKTLVSAQSDGLIYTWDWAAILADVTP